MDSEKLKVAIIDSGVRTNHPRFTGDTIEGFHFASSGCDSNFEDVIGHGTAVYGIIREVASFCEITNIKITDRSDSVDETVLIGVLEYICEHLEFDLINLSASISICEQYERLNDVCERIREKGTVLVSSFDNIGSISYPAAFNNVIGVTSDPYCHRNSDIAFVENSPVNLGANGGVQRLCWTSPDYVFLGGNSFACAHASVEILNIMRKNSAFSKGIQKSIKSSAKYIYPFEDRRTHKIASHHIQRAALFPFNKEMHSLIRFSDLLKFDIINVYDIKYSGNIGATTDHILKEKNAKDFQIKNIDNIDWSSIDTLILGHTDELSYAIDHVELQSDILNGASKSGVFVYAFDDLTHLINSMESPPAIYFPEISIKDMPLQAFNKLHRISRPVVGVFGTSSRQGKFTLQLVLRRKFQEAGYSVGQIGSEPSSLLYGMDSVFPMGYHSSVHIHELDVIHFLNSEMHKLCNKGSDIIIVGSQSGTVSYDMGNLEQINLIQYEFLLGTQPDRVILCINPYDEIKFIRRTIQFVESSIDCKVIALVMFPMDFKSNFSGIYGGKRRISIDEFISKSDLLENKLSLPVYCLGSEEDMIDLTNSIISCFSEESH